MRDVNTRCPRWLACALVVLGLAPGATQAQEAADYFRQNCASCHTIGGTPLSGPDLKGVLERVRKAGKDEAWLTDFIANAKGMIDSGDPYAQQLYERYRPV